MWIEIKNINSDVEVLNTSFIVKIMESQGTTRINMADSSYVRTRENLDDIWAKMEEGS